MKYLFTFAAVASPVEQDFIGAQHGRLENADNAALLRELEQLVLASLNEAPDAVAFYRAMMDGWDATHRALSQWVSRHRPEGEEAWSDFCNTGLLVWQATRSTGLGLEPRPNMEEMISVTRSNGIEAYALLAFLHAIYDTMEFAVATKTTLVAIGRCIGASRDDGEYR